MLIKFQSKAAADVLMYEKHAEPLLRLLNKDAQRGIITAAQTGDAIAAIEGEILRTDQMAQDEATAASAQQRDNDEDDDPRRTEPVRLSVRAYPLLEMLRAANRQQADVVWGV